MKSRIYFPPLPTPGECIRTYESFRKCCPSMRVYGVFDSNGDLRSWNVSESNAREWAHHYMWDECSFRLLATDPARTA